MVKHDAAVQVLLLALAAYLGNQTQLRESECRRILSRRKLALLRIARRRRHPVWAQPRSQHWWETIVPDFSPEQFLLNFHVSRETFEYICDRLESALGRRDTNFRLCVPIRKRVAIALWKLASGSEYSAIGRLFGVGVSTVCVCVQAFCSAAIKVLLPVHIRSPDADQLVEMASVFKKRWGIPQCVGAIDASHIPILAPRHYPRDYINRRGWHSVVLQAAVDGNGLLWDVCVGFAGSVPDARVLRQSDLWTVLGDGALLGQHKVSVAGCDVGHYLVGDAAYPLQDWLMKPFTDTGKLTPEQLNYNHRLSSARSVAETCFQRLKGRWRCLLKRNDNQLELSKKMALTCCVLHNICEDRGDSFPLEVTDRSVNIQPHGQALPERLNREGSHIRAALMTYFNKGE